VDTLHNAKGGFLATCSKSSQKVARKKKAVTINQLILNVN